MCLSERKFDNNMRLPNGYGSVVKMSGKRRKPYMVRKTIGWHLDETKGRQIQDFQIIGYPDIQNPILGQEFLLAAIQHTALT